MKICNLLVACILFALVSPILAIAQQQPDSVPSTVPRLMRFSGVITNGSVKTPTGVAGVTFSLYKDQEGGAPLWMETQNVKFDSAGHYTAYIGSSKADGLPLDLFASGEARWLGVQVDGQPEQPRVLLLSVPYALKAGDAETLGGKPASAYTLTPTQENAASPSKAVTRGAATKAASGAVTPAIAGTGTTGYFARWTSSTNLGNSLFYQTTGGLIGLGTTSPTQKLQINTGNMIVKGPANFVSSGNLARVFVGDANHALTARYSGGLSLDTYLVSNALFVQDRTGRVGVGTTSPLSLLHVKGVAQIGPGTSSPKSMLNVASNSPSISGLSAAGFSGTSSSDGMVVVGGANTSANATAGTGIVVTGGGASGAAGTGGTGLVVNGGANATIPGIGGTAIVATGGNAYLAGGTAIVARGGLGEDGQGDGIDAYGGGGYGSGNGVVGYGGNLGGSGVIGYTAIPGSDGLYGRGVGVVGVGLENTDVPIPQDGILGIRNPAAGGYAGDFNGNVNVTGTLFAATKSFRIDHPLDPANKYLLHASVESSEMLDVYSGNTLLDGRGESTIQLPQWFEAVNTDFRYQLTAVGAPSPGLYIAKEISNHQFTIAGGAPGSKVSWQVSSVRHDPYAKANPLVVEQTKDARERGYYIHPQLYGAPEERGVQWARHPEIMRRTQEIRLKKTSTRGNASGKQIR